MTGVVVQVDGVIGSLKSLALQIEKETALVVEDTARYAKKQADVTRLYNDKTGRLRRSTTATFVRSDMRSFIENKTPYAKYIEDGTVPHVIRARRAPMLRFFWEKVGRVVEFKSVNHPGTAPRPVFKAAGYLGHTFLVTRLGEAIDRRVTAYNKAK